MLYALSMLYESMSSTDRLTDLLTYRANTRGPGGPKKYEKAFLSAKTVLCYYRKL